MDLGGSQQAGPASHGPPTQHDFLEAARSGDPEALPGLLAREGADMDVRATTGVTVLTLAILEEDTAAVTALLENGADVNMETLDGQSPLSIAVSNGFTAMVALLLENNADPNYQESGSLMPLHIASIRGDVDVARLLIDHGADVRGQAPRGVEPLYVAVGTAPEPAALTSLLLQHGANPDVFCSVQPGESPTPLHMACSRGNVETVGLLLEADAKVDVRDAQGATPLFSAVEKGHVEVVRLLLQRGASTHILREDGQSPLDLAQGTDQLVKLLKSEKVFQGPRIGAPEEPQPQAEPSALRPPPKVFSQDMLVACKGFDVTITDFFTKEDQEQQRHEQILVKSESVHDVLYAQGPSAVMRPARESQMDDGKPEFTWYHIPSNNMAWAEHLIRRLVVERGNTSGEAYAAATDELDLALPGTGGRLNGRRVARMRPHFRQVPSTSSLSWSKGTDNVVAFVPFLHLETYAAYRKMARAVDEAGQPRLTMNIKTTDAKSRSQRRSSRAVESEKGTSSGADSSSISSTTERNGVATWFGSAARSLRINATRQWWRMTRTRPEPSVDSDLEGRSSENERSGSRLSRDSHLPTRASGSSVIAPRGAGSRVSEPRVSAASVGDGQGAGGPPQRPGTTQDNDVEAPPSVEDVPPGTDASRRSTDRQSRAHRSARSAETPDARVVVSGVAGTSKNLHEHLIHGYLASGPSREPSLQLRQTLDQYLYSHLESTSQRDDDQVVYRFTQREPTPKMFMVDQLWMWILGNDTIVTCFPLQWDAWLLRGGERSTRPQLLQPIPPGPGMAFPSFFPTQVRHSSKPSPAKYMATRKVSIWDAKSKGKPPKPHRRPQRHEAVERRPVLKPEDPMSVSQNIFFHLSRGSREPVGTVYELAGLITTHCVDVFDTNRVPEDYQFFEFFEQSISDVSDKVASRLAIFRKGLQDHEIEGIEEEIELAIEIEDIRDELNILKTVLTDQESIVGGMDKTLATMSGGRATPVNTKTRHHLMAWVLQMEKTAGKTHTALHRLIDLKMNQASLTEAFFARRSALDTASQGRTVVVFTLVTIVFLPMSFMAAIFAINTNGFPLDSDDRIPFDYLMKYLVSIGLALSIPFIYVAFNVDIIAKRLRAVLEMFDGIVGRRARQTALAIPALLVIYLPLLTSSLSSGIKAAVSIFVALVVLVTICVQLINSQTRRTLKTLKTDADSSSS